MASYFRNLPEFDYVSRVVDNKNIGDYVRVKNLFKRVKLNEDILSNLQFFTKYNIIGNERPDNIARKIYNDETLDWVVLISNNIIDVREEWPLPQESFDNYLLDKYGSYANLEKVKHYETIEVKNKKGMVIVPKGIIVPSNYSITYYDNTDKKEVIASNITKAVTFYDYEIDLDNKKRTIFLLKPEYLSLVFNDIKFLMEYKEGSGQFVSRTLKRGDNIRLYE